jgi:membrane associated rhomboid family serine protease
VGASGSVFGLLLAFGMIFPNMRLYIFPLPIPIKAKYFVIFYGLFELFAGIRSVSGLSSDNVAHFAHLGGLVFGLILILIWRKTTNDNNFNQMY